MPTGVARTASGISIAIARDPALVRTVRLIAAAVARRSGRSEDFVEEVRLAVGEACALLVGAEPMTVTPGSGPVTVRLTLDERLTVEVEAEGGAATDDPSDGDLDGVEPWALLRGLIDDFDIEQAGATTRLRMSWPAV